MIKLTLTDKQAEIVSRACEFFTRIRIGQFGEIIWNCAPKHCVKDPDAAEKAWLDLRKHIYPDLLGPGHSYGVGHFEDADISYDVHQVLRYALGDKRELFSGYHPLPKCVNTSKEQDDMSIELNCRLGDVVWGLRKVYGGKYRAEKGEVSDIRIVDRNNTLSITVRYVCRGEWGKRVFPTKEAAEAALLTSHVE